MDSGRMTRAFTLPSPDRMPPLVVLAVALALWAVLYAPFLSFSVSDFKLHVKPWLDYIRSHGGAAALSDNFSEYAPPYLYLLTAATYVNWPFDDQVLVKMVNLPFVLAAAAAVYVVCTHFGKSRNYALVAAAATALLPTLGINAFIWGQADALYASLLLWSAVLVLLRKPYWAVAMFAASLSIKLQSMFLAPFILAMVFAGRIPWQAGFVAPLVYMLSILPAWIIGRPLNELLTVYLVQGRYYNQLAFNAPNFYFFLDFLFGASKNWQVYKLFTLIGLLASAGVGALISATGIARKGLNDRTILLIATLSVMIMPFVLPKMHDRYFIVADLFIFALAWIDRRFVWPAVAMQISSGLALAPEFSLHALPGDYQAWRWGVIVGGLINAGVILYLLRELKRDLGALWDTDAIRKALPPGPAKTV